MVAKNFYDAVIIGLDLRTLLAGALLAKRGLRVLLVAEGQPPPSYEARGVRLPRAPFSLTAFDSPLYGRVFGELALRPLVQRLVEPLTPPFQAILPGHRFDFAADPRLLARELERELPDARPFTAQLHAALERSRRAWEPLLARDLMWPAEGFFERRAFAHALGLDPFAALPPSPPRHDLPREHPLMRVLAELVRFSGGALEDPYDGRTLRLLDARLHAAELGEGGLSGLYDLLTASIRTHNGSLRFSDRVESLTVRRGTLTGVHLAPSDEEIGCQFLLWGLPVSRLASRLADRSELDPLFSETGEPRAIASRFTLNLVVPRDALPEGMGRDLLLAFDPPMWIERKLVPASDRAVLCIETLLPAEPAEERARRLKTQRERMLEALDELSPFLRSQVLLVDSPHDGRPTRDLEQEVESTSEPHLRGPDTMRHVYTFSSPRLHGSAALTVRTPIKRLLLCNDQVVGGLGLEGSFLTAWSAARVVTRALRRGFMNRGRWTKVEL
jgi:hypothetical protein